MAINDYRLIKEISDGAFVERKITPDQTKVWGWDASLDPIAVAIPRTYVIAAVSLNDGDWNLNSGLYELDYTNANVTDTMTARVVPHNGDYDTYTTAVVLPRVLVTNGNIRIYAQYKPAAPMRVDIILHDFITF